MQSSGHAQCPAEEARAAHTTLPLIQPEQSLEERQGHIGQLMNNLSAVLGAAEASEAAVSAAVNAIQTELPHSDEVIVITLFLYYI